MDFLSELGWMWWAGLGALFLLIVIFIFLRKSQQD